MTSTAFDQKFFRRASLKLVSGNALAQAIFVLAAPVLTRLFSPEDFSGMGIYLAFVMIGLSCSCLRFDVAIPIAKDDSEAKITRNQLDNIAEALGIDFETIYKSLDFNPLTQDDIEIGTALQTIQDKKVSILFKGV